MRPRRATPASCRRFPRSIRRLRDGGDGRRRWVAGGRLQPRCGAARPSARRPPCGLRDATRHFLRLPDADGQVEALSRREDRPIDLVEVNGRLALFTGAGWDARSPVVTPRPARTPSRLGGRGDPPVPDLWRRWPVEVRADGWVDALRSARAARDRHDALLRPRAEGQPRRAAGRWPLSLRVYPGPAPWLALEAGRWAIGVRPHAPRIDATEATLRAPRRPRHSVQADGDLIGRPPTGASACARGPCV